ncbi:MAG: hypothetical protein PVH17_03000 [Anaerolineae bacterium]|jgi:hypothetical protein
MSKQETDASTQRRMAETVRLVISRRERAPRSPRMERALKRLIWRYVRARKGDERI